MGANMQMMTRRPFSLSVPRSTLEDLNDRLLSMRWPDEAANAGWSYGTNLGYMRDLADHWLRDYDWPAHEAEINKFHHYHAEVDGVGIHFIHERGRGPNPKPLLLIHGWPDSFYRFHRVIPMLTDPARFGGDPSYSFDVVVPSIPGHGFSDRLAMSSDAVGDLFVKLMTDVLGYNRFVSAGGDQGSLITKALAASHPDRLLGIHLTDVGYPDDTTDLSALSPAEKEFAGYIQKWWMTEGAYNMVQSTKPQTLSYGLNDSPGGLAAWIMSFICIGTTGEAIEKRIERDELLTNIMIYWITQTINSSVRMYYENAHAPATQRKGGRSEVPAAVAHCPWDAPLPREWAERNVNLKRYTEMPRGGHFLAWEEPELYAKDLQQFIAWLNR